MFWCDAFAIGGPRGIIPFYRSPSNTSSSSHSLDVPCPQRAIALSTMISQGMRTSGYGRFRPHNRDCHLWRWCYRGGWHQSYPPLILRAIYARQKPMQCMSTEDPLITLSCIVKVSRLLHPVGLGPVSQCPSPGYLSQGPYRSTAWWAITPPTT